mmetsp:Transcript_35682/g.70615  ORF Transcript_35682/g.70615 Transcript_35682/m.70615 type:complete len:752 (+) Transcript_35682:51-2306(+)
MNSLGWDSEAPLPDRIWCKLQRAERLTRNYQCNFRSNKHGRHNRRRQPSHKQLRASDRKISRQMQAASASRRSPGKVVWQVLQALQCKEHSVGDLRAAIRDVKLLGIAKEPLGVAVFLHAQEVLKTARAALTKCVQTKRALEASELVAFLEAEAPLLDDVPVHLRASACALLREAQAVAGSLWRATSYKLQAERDARRPSVHQWYQRNWYPQAWRDAHRRRKSWLYKEKRTAHAELRELTGRLSLSLGKSVTPRELLPGLRSKPCAQSPFDLQEIATLAAGDPDMYRDEDSQEVIEFDMHAATDSQDVWEHMHSSSTGGREHHFVHQFLGDMRTFSDTGDEEAVASCGWNRHSPLIGSVRDVCRGVLDYLRGSLRDVLDQQDECRRLVQQHLHYRQEVSNTRMSCKEVTWEDALAGLQAMRSSQHADMQPMHMEEAMVLHPLPDDPCARDRASLREAMTRVFTVLRALCTWARRRHRRSHLHRCSRPHDCLRRLLTRSCELRDELHERFAESSEKRQCCISAHKHRLEAWARRRAEAEERSEALIAEWCELGGRIRAERALELPPILGLCAATQNHFDCLRDAFLREHGYCVRRHLSKVFPGYCIRLLRAPVSLPLQASFLQTWRDADRAGVLLRPAFHGTKVANLESIFERGLLIPGQGNTLRVVNGKAHGLGIYTARVRTPCLSKSFARGNAGMLVVGVLDDAVEVDKSERLGSFHVSAESASIRHVGDAMVVLDPSRVLPFFQVCLGE